jgi:hypothetical protein
MMTDALRHTRRELSNTGQVPASGPLAIDLGAPVSGFVWDVRRITIIDAIDPTLTFTGTVFVVTPQGGDTQVLRPNEIADVTACGLPAVATYSRGTIVLEPNEHVQVWLYNVTPATRIIAVAQVEEVRT